MPERDTAPDARRESFDTAALAGALGARLREAREARGWSLEDVSIQLKYSARQVRALEDETWDALPRGTPLRGFVRNYARLLDLDPAPLLALLTPDLQQSNPVSLEQASSLSSPLAPSTGRALPMAPRRRPAAWIMRVLMLLLAVLLLGYALMQQGRLPFLSGAVDRTDALGLPLAEAPSSPDAAFPPAMPDAAPATDAGPLPAALPPGTVASGGGEPLAPPPPEPAPAAEPPAAPVAASRLQVQAASWIDVRDGEGRVALSRIVQPGETIELDAAAAPLRVVVGNVSGVTLVWRGDVIDMTPHRRDNVARLTLR